MTQSSDSQPGVCIPPRYATSSRKKQLKSRKKSTFIVVWVDFSDFWVSKRGTILIWGYPEGYNFGLGVPDYLNVENP